MSVSNSEEGSGIDKEPHPEVVDPNEQLAKPAGSFFTEDFNSAGWED